MDKLFLDKNAKLIIDKLYEHKFQAYIVGGCVRDMLLGKTPKDIDITTNARPYDIIDIFKNNYKVIETGIKYGTITVVIDNIRFEITTFRSENNYTDGRRPEIINFENDVKYDLSRRDFTINSMAYNDKVGLIDLFNGQDDLKNKMIRCVGNPIERFKEDKLRMLRAIRFSARFDFQIEKNTSEAIKIFSNEISNVSMERINQEFSQIILADAPSKGIKLLYDTGLLANISCVINDMHGFDQQNPYHKKDLFEHTLEVLDNTESDIITRLSALFHDTGKLYTKTIDEKHIAHYYGHNKISSEIAKKELKKLRYPNSIITSVCNLTYKHMIDPDSITSKGIRRLILSLGMDDLKRLINLQKADSKSTTIGENNIFENKVKKVLEQENVFSKKDLAINGYDLIDMGYKGKEIGEVLDYLLDIVLENPNLNDKEILLEKIKLLKRNKENDGK